MYREDVADLQRRVREAVDAAEAELRPQAKALSETAEATERAAQDLNDSWSQSNVGAHAFMYFREFERPSVPERWDPEWGFLHPQPDGWAERSSDEVVERVERTAGTSVQKMLDDAKALRDKALHHQHAVVVLLDEVPEETAVRLGIHDRKKELDDLEGITTVSEIVRRLMGTSHMTRDSGSLNQGIWTAPHQTVIAQARVAESVAVRVEEMLRLARRAQATLASARLLPDPGPIAPGGESQSKSAVWTTRISAGAVCLVLVAIVGGLLWLPPRVQDLQADAEGVREVIMRVLASAVGGVGVFAATLLILVCWNGVIRGDPDYLERAWDDGFKTGAILGASAAVIYVFGIA